MRDRLGAGLEPFVERRIGALGVGLAAVFAVFLFRLFQLQVVQGDELRDRSQRNSIRTVRLEAPRGDIVDRFGRALATSRPAFELEVIPNELKSPERTFAALARLIDVDEQDLAERYGRPQGRARFQPVRLVSDLSYDRLARVESHRYALPGVVTDVRPRRHYTDGDVAAHLLGTIGEVRADQLATRNFAGYRQGETVGQSGLERLLEPHLRGRAGGRNVAVDVAGREVELIEQVDSVPGGTVVLALDLELQREAVRAFAAAGADGSPRSGALVALDPRNGDVLALVSRPSYDPNAFAAGIPAAEWNRLRNDPRRPLLDRALAGQYPPGSTYKPIVAAALLEEGVMRLGERLFCPGHFSLGGRIFRCWRRGGHGWVDLSEAIEQSCDVFFYQAGLKLGIDRLAEYAHGFNLGRPTNIPLPQEESGLVPTRDWKERRYREAWMPGETVSAAIGQGFNLVTPLQLAVAFAALGNGGRIVQPRLVLRLETHGGDAVQETLPVFRGRVSVSQENLDLVRNALVEAVESRHGTGSRARLPGVHVAGKTGTAQVVGLQHTEGTEPGELEQRYRDHAWFAAFAPAEAPEIVVVVLLEHGGGGGEAAAPIAARVLGRYFDRAGSGGGTPTKPGPRQAVPVTEESQRAAG